MANVYAVPVHAASVQIRLGPEELFMTVLVLVLGVVWALVALSTAFVVGHGIALADARRPFRKRSGEAETPAYESRPVAVS